MKSLHRTRRFLIMAAAAIAAITTAAPTAALAEMIVKPGH